MVDTLYRVSGHVRAEWVVTFLERATGGLVAVVVAAVIVKGDRRVDLRPSEMDSLAPALASSPSLTKASSLGVSIGVSIAFWAIFPGQITTHVPVT